MFRMISEVFWEVPDGSGDVRKCFGKYWKVLEGSRRFGRFRKILEVPEGSEGSRVFRNIPEDPC